MSTPAERLNLMQEVGELLYGRHWIDHMKTALGVSLRTIGYWKAGIGGPPEDLREQLERIYRSHLPIKIAKMEEEVRRLAELFEGAGAEGEESLAA